MTRALLWTLSLSTALVVFGCGGETSSPGAVSKASVGGTPITLKTSLAGKFVSAENGGGGVVDATRDVASVWETFQLTDFNGGALQNGDQINLQASNGQYLSAEGGGGGALVANRNAASGWEAFRVIKLSGGDGVVRDGDAIALQTAIGGNYLSAINGGGAGVVADRTAIQSWETFLIGLSSSSPGNGCSAAQLPHCNCPSGFHCCPTDGSCFQNDSDVVFTQCKNDPASTCVMGGTVSNPPPPPPPPPSNLPTRLRITSRCAQPIWIAHSDNVPEAQNILLQSGQSHDYGIPSGGLASARFWPKTGCDGSGHGCAVGDNGQGGGVPCPANGCQPPVDSKFEVSFAAAGSGAQTWYNLSQVDGYTLPFKVAPSGAGANQGSCVASDCSQLSLDRCPGDENMSGGGGWPAYTHEDLRVRDGSGRVIACMAPCKKWNYPAPWGLGRSEGEDPGLHLCCPTPIDPATGQCTVANHCMSSPACSNAADPVSVVHTSYVAAIRSMCPSAYSYAYDDAAGLHACASDTSFEVTFCP